MAKRNHVGELLGREYILAGLKALKAGIEKRLAENREKLSSMEELKKEEGRLRKQLQELGAEIKAAGKLPEVDLQFERKVGTAAKPVGPRRKTRPKASADQVKAMVREALGDRTQSLADIKASVKERLREQGKTAQGVHKTLQKVLREKPFEATKQGYRIKE